MKLVPAEEILAHFGDLRHLSHWPRREEGNRLEPEAWPILQPRFTLNDASTIFTIGSCFARSIEEHLSKFGYTIPMLGFGVPKEEFPSRPNGILNKYAMPSILNDLEWTLSVREFASEQKRNAHLLEPVIKLGDQAIDLDLAGYIAVSESRALERRRQIYQTNINAFSADVVVMTFGLLETWWDAERKRYILQMPSPQMVAAYPGRFHFSTMSFHDAYDYAKRAIDCILNHGNPATKFLITTSPVPLHASFSGEDVLIANTFAKSTLRSICGHLVRDYDQVDYFPSYESVMLSKAPGVWRDDLTHVTGDFVAKIVDHLQQSYFPMRQATHPLQRPAYPPEKLT